MVIRKEDLADLDIVDALELGSDGYYIFLSAIGQITSTTSSTKTVVINGFLLNDRDNPVEAGDRVRLLNTSGADGYYIINSIINTTSFTVVENISDSTGGDGYFMYNAGALRVGFDPTGLSITTSKNLQGALKDVAINVSGITNTHKSLRQLIHFIDNGPADGFVSGAYREILPINDPFPTSVIWWESIAKIEKIVEKTYTYNDNKTVSQIQWKMYDTDGTTILTTVTDSITYSGIFEVSRTRSIS